MWKQTLTPSVYWLSDEASNETCKWNEPNQSVLFISAARVISPFRVVGGNERGRGKKTTQCMHIALGSRRLGRSIINQRLTGAAHNVEPADVFKDVEASNEQFISTQFFYKVERDLWPDMYLISCANICMSSRGSSHHRCSTLTWRESSGRSREVLMEFLGRLNYTKINVQMNVSYFFLQKKLP